MLDILNNWFQNGNQQSQQQMPNLRQSWINQFLQQQQPTQQQAPQQQMPQMPMQTPQMQNGLAPNFRQQLYLQNLMNQQSQGFGSPYSPSYNPNNLPPGAGQNLNPPVRGEIPAPVVQQPVAAQQPGMGAMKWGDINNYLNSAKVGSRLSANNMRQYFGALGDKNTSVYHAPNGWQYDKDTGDYYRFA